MLSVFLLLCKMHDLSRYLELSTIFERIKQVFVKLLKYLPSEYQAPLNHENTRTAFKGIKLKKVRLICPFAEDFTSGQKTRGFYRRGFPEGAVIHYTAGTGSLQNAAHYASNKGYNYFIIDKSGKIAQLAPLNRWGYHAGKSSCYLGEDVSQFLVGIEVICAGRLIVETAPENGEDVYKTWWGYAVPKENVVEKDNKVFEKFTQQQVASLSKLIIWLKKENPDVFEIRNVFGHEEVSPGRKEDPGPSLCTPMHLYRVELNVLVQMLDKKD